MAYKKTAKKEEVKKESKISQWVKVLRNTMKHETTQFVLGLLCTMIALYMILAFSSFILNGGADQSAMEQPSIIESLEGINDEIKNSTGKKGAHIAQLLINKTFGVSAFSLALFLLVLGLNQMRAYRFNLKHWGICCGTILIWVSLFCSITIDRWFTSSGIYWRSEEHTSELQTR